MVGHVTYSKRNSKHSSNSGGLSGVRVVIIGRPNAGKSTLFNRLTGTRRALVDNRPGVTRDWREAAASLTGLEFRLIDTAGLAPELQDAISQQMNEASLEAAQKADLVLFMIDARAGLETGDLEAAALLRKTGKPLILIANKCEGKKASDGLMEAFRLGLGEPVAISAAHGEGLVELYHALENALGPLAEIDQIEPASDEQAPLRIAIVGRPNAGKSTLINKLIGEKRVITSDQAGTTRDAVYLDWNWQGKPVRLVDTAGLRKQSRMDDVLERAAAAAATQAIELCEVAVMVSDSMANVTDESGLARQELALAERILNEGRALVIAVNKCDLLEDEQAFLDRLSERLSRSLPQAVGVPVVAIEAVNGRHLDRLMENILTQYDLWNRRFNTAELNRWLEDIVRRNPPPMVQGRRSKPRYLTQVKSRPPTLALFGNRLSNLPESWKRYLLNRLRADFSLPGVPIRLMLKHQNNPYTSSTESEPSSRKRSKKHSAKPVS